MVFEKPSKQITQHLKPLYIKVHMNGRPVNKVLVNNGVAVNILPYKMLNKLAKTEKDLTPSNMTINGFTGEPNITKGIISIQVKVGSKVIKWRLVLMKVLPKPSRPIRVYMPK
jgi:hypothetical protein